MSRPAWFDAKITAGNVLTIAVMIVGFFIWGVRLEARVDEQGKALIELRATDANLASRLETARDLAGTRQEAVLSRLARIEAILERMDKRP